MNWEERDQHLQDPNQQAYERMETEAKHEMNALAPPKQISNEMAMGKRDWLGDTGRFIAGCAEIGGEVKMSNGHTIHSHKRQNTKAEIDSAIDQMDRVDENILVCDAPDTTVKGYRNPHNKDELLMVEAEDHRAKEYIVNPHVQAEPELKGLGQSGKIELKARDGEIEITDEGIREIDRPEEKVDDGEAMNITGRDNPEAAQKTLEYETRKARSELDRVTVNTTR